MWRIRELKIYTDESDSTVQLGAMTIGKGLRDFCKTVSSTNFKTPSDSKTPLLANSVHIFDFNVRMYSYIKRANDAGGPCSLRRLMDIFYADLQFYLDTQGTQVLIVVADDPAKVTSLKEAVRRKRGEQAERSGIKPYPDEKFTVDEEKGTVLFHETETDTFNPADFMATKKLRRFFMMQCRRDFMTRKVQVLPSSDRVVIFDFQGKYKRGEHMVPCPPMYYSRKSTKELPEHIHPFGEGEFAQTYWAGVYRDRVRYIHTVDQDIMPIAIGLINAIEEKAAEKAGTAPEAALQERTFFWIYPDTTKTGGGKSVVVDMVRLYKDLITHYEKEALKRKKHFNYCIATAFCTHCAFFGTDYVDKHSVVKKNLRVAKIHSTIQEMAHEIRSGRNWMPVDMKDEGASVSIPRSPGRGAKRKEPDDADGGLSVIEKIVLKLKPELQSVKDKPDTQRVFRLVGWQVRYWLGSWDDALSATPPSD